VSRPFTRICTPRFPINETAPACSLTTTPGERWRTVRASVPASVTLLPAFTMSRSLRCSNRDRRASTRTPSRRRSPGRREIVPTSCRAVEDERGREVLGEANEGNAEPVRACRDGLDGEPAVISRDGALHRRRVGCAQQQNVCARDRRLAFVVDASDERRLAGSG